MWQPIETAPKDGTHILIYRAAWANSIAVCYWSRDNDEWQTGLYSPFNGAIYWMPLPEPPK